MKYCSDKRAESNRICGSIQQPVRDQCLQVKGSRIETCGIVRSRHLFVVFTSSSIFPAISSSLKAAVLLQRDFLKAMLVLSEAPGSFQHVAATWESVDNTLRVSADLERPRFHTHTPASNQLPNSLD